MFALLTLVNDSSLRGPFQLHCVTLYCFYDVNLTISPLDRPITAEFTKGVFHDDISCQHSLFINNSKNNHYFTNYSTYNRSVSTNDHWNS